MSLESWDLTENLEIDNVICENIKVIQAKVYSTTSKSLNPDKFPLFPATTFYWHKNKQKKGFERTNIK